MIKGLLMDYGGTIDTNGKHWGEVLWNAYVQHNVPVTKTDFRAAYSYGERALAIHPLIKPEHNFHDVLIIKLQQQFDYLKSNQLLKIDDPGKWIHQIAGECDAFAARVTEDAKLVLKELSARYPIVLVSNFYGNIHTVLQHYGLLPYFKDVVESAVVGVRKPDPAIFSLGVQALGFNATDCVVIGDSYTKDIAPGKKAGCNTTWLKGEGWGDDPADTSMADKVIFSFDELPGII